MSMSTHVYGERDLESESEFHKMIKVKLACEEAGVAYPYQVCKYFGEEHTKSVEYLQSEMQNVEIGDAVTRKLGDCSDIWMVDLSKLPKDCKRVCFENSY